MSRRWRRWAGLSYSEAVANATWRTHQLLTFGPYVAHQGQSWTSVRVTA